MGSYVLTGVGDRRYATEPDLLPGVLRRCWSDSGFLGEGPNGHADVCAAPPTPTSVAGGGQSLGAGATMCVRHDVDDTRGASRSGDRRVWRLTAGSDLTLCCEMPECRRLKADDAPTEKCSQPTSLIYVAGRAARSAAWSSIALPMACDARSTNSVPLPMTQSARGGRSRELAGEMRNHVLREQLVALELRGGRGPVVVEQEERAEAAVARLDELLDLGHRVLGCADHRETGLVVVGDDLRRGVALDGPRGQDVREVAARTPRCRTRRRARPARESRRGASGRRGATSSGRRRGRSPARPPPTLPSGGRGDPCPASRSPRSTTCRCRACPRRADRWGRRTPRQRRRSRGRCRASAAAARPEG